MLLRLTLTAMIFAAAPVFAQPAPNSASLAAQRLVGAVNADPAARAAFAATAYATSALKAEPATARSAFLDQLAADSGGLDVVDLKIEGPRMAEAVVASRAGGRFARLVLFTSRDEPDKISSFFVLPARDPAKAKAEVWPTAPVPRARLTREIAARLESLSRDDLFSGVVLVAEKGRIIFRRAYGLANQAWQAPNKTDTAYHGASVTKMFTAAAILKLAADKRISLDDTLAAWAPEYPHPAAAASITLRHLLTHTSGVGDVGGPGSQARTTVERVRGMTQAPEVAPGARFRYSNDGFILLGAVIEKATGQSFGDALDTLILKPLGMTRTAAWPVTAIIPNRATGYLREASDPFGVRPRRANDQYLGYGGDGSGGLYTTADDLLAFHLAVIGGKLLGPEATQLFLSPVTEFPGTPRPSQYGLGMRFSSCAGQPVFGHSGGGANSGVSNATFATRDGRWTVIVLSNYDPMGEEVAQGICDTVTRTGGT